MNNQDLYSAIAHQLYNQKIPIKVFERVHDAHDLTLRLHSHDFMEWGVVADGSATHTVLLQNQEFYHYRIKKGSFFLIKTNEKHTFTFEGNESLSLKNVLFDPSVFKNINLNTNEDQPSFLDNYYSSLQLPEEIRFDNAVINEQQQSFVFSLVDNLKQECNNSNSDIYKKLLLFMLILSYTQSQLNTPLIQESDYKFSSIMRLVVYLQHHFTENLSLNDLCKVALCGERNLTRRFKQLTNETITQYIARLRINKACTMLVNTDLSITDIASEVGYLNSAFFGKKFKEQTNYTPSEYRNAFRLPALKSE